MRGIFTASTTSAVSRQSASFTRNVTRPPKPRIVLRRDVVIRMRRQARVIDLLDPRMAGEELGDAHGRSRCAAASAARTSSGRARADSMLCGPLIAPMMPRSLRTGSSFSFEPMITPASRSLWPPRYLVAEWST